MSEVGQQVLHVALAHPCDSAHGRQAGAQGAAQPCTQVLVASRPVWAVPEVPQEFLELPSLGGLAGDVLKPMEAALKGAGEIGFTEQFSLADDRSEPLKQLIPGTEDYYYYHCLHFQNTEQFDKVNELLTAWFNRFKALTSRS